MSILDKIYEAYREGILSIKPPKTGKNIQKMFEELYKVDAEQAQELEDFVFDIADRQGESMFEAGFKLAVELIMNASKR